MTYMLRIAALSLLTLSLLAADAAGEQQQPQKSATRSGTKRPDVASGSTASHPAAKGTPGSGTAPAAKSTPTHAEVVASSSDRMGSLSGANLYTNPALQMTLQLTGEWQFMDEEMRRMAEGRGDKDDPAAQEQETKRRSQCTGPLCGEPEINIALFTELNPTMAVSSVFIAGFKLAPEYLDRERYPLKKFAEIMLPHSAAEVGLQAADSLADIQLGGRPAFRLLVQQPGEEKSREVGYVVESNGYMVLLVASTSQTADLPKLQAAIEAVKFK